MLYFHCRFRMWCFVIISFPLVGFKGNLLPLASEDMFSFFLLVLRGIYHYWTYCLIGSQTALSEWKLMVAIPLSLLLHLLSHGQYSVPSVLLDPLGW